LTANENPKLNDMYNSCDGLLGAPTVFASGVEARRATWVPEKAKKRNNVVPANSALVATKWFRACKVKESVLRSP
jgi:hypothetical protein